MDELRDYKPRQLTEGWLEFLRRQSPDIASGVAMALAGIPAARMPIRSGPAQGLTPQDFAMAPQLERQSASPAAGELPANYWKDTESRIGMPASGTLKAVHGLIGGPNGKWPPRVGNTALTDEQMFANAMSEQQNAWILEKARLGRFNPIKGGKDD